MVMSGISPDTLDVFEMTGFKPNPGGQEKLLACRKRIIGGTGGEQGGKSVTMGWKFIDFWLDDISKYQRCDVPRFCTGHEDGVKCEETLYYWLVGKDYLSTEKEWFYIGATLHAMGLHPDVPKRFDPGTITIRLKGDLLPRLQIDTKSARDPETAFARVAPHGILACEAGQLDIGTYNRLRARIAPRRGWMLLLGTIEKSQPWFPQMLDNWKFGHDDRQSFEIPSWENLHLYPGGRNDPEILALAAESSDDFFMERIAGKKVPLEGLVFPEFTAEHHVRETIYRPGEKVYIFEDPGYGKASAHAVLACHIIKDRVHIFDELYERGIVTEDVIRLLEKREWWREEKVLISDPNYKDAHHSMPSVAEQWEKQTGLIAGGERGKIVEGIERLKSFLRVDPLTGEARVQINPQCTGILSEFGAAPSPFSGLEEPYLWRTDSSGRLAGITPEDRSNHSIKALIYGITDLFGYGSYGVKRAIVTKRGRISSTHRQMKGNVRDSNKFLVG